MQLPGIALFRLCTLSDQELAYRAAEKLNEMYTKGGIPTRNVPARPNEDFDILVAELILRLLDKSKND